MDATNLILDLILNLITKGVAANHANIDNITNTYSE